MAFDDGIAGMTPEQCERRRKTEVEAVITECANLLIVYFSYVETIKRFTPKIATRIDLLSWRIHLRVMENDLILRLCRLDDDDKTNHSLREALRSVRNFLSDAEARAIGKSLTKYRKVVNPLKTRARHYYLAHLSKTSDVPFATDSHGIPGNFHKQITEVVNIVDMIAGEGEPIKYIMRVGSQEPQIDLRQKLLDKHSF